MEPRERLALLPGLQAGAAIRGRIICSCFSLDDTAIRDAIRANKPTTAAEIGAALRAGTNCGSCIPELENLLTANVAGIAMVI